MEEIRITVGGGIPKMPTLPETKSIPGVAPESQTMGQDVRATVETIASQLNDVIQTVKLIQNRMFEAMPYIARASDRDGGK